MSGIEVIGLILGGLPLVISAAEDYKRGFEPFLKWHRYKREFRGFVNSVDLEKQMFDGLLGQLLKYTDLPLDDKQLLLSGSDPEAWRREQTVDALKVRLGDSYLSCMYILETMKDDMVILQSMMSLKDGSVEWVKPGEDKWNYQRKRIAHSFSKKGTETIVSLEKNNRKFRELLDLLDTKLVDGKSTRGKAVGKDTTWAKLFECIRRQASSLHLVLANGWKCTCIGPHLTALQLQERGRLGSSSNFTLTFSSTKVDIQKSISLRKVIVTVNDPETTKHSVDVRRQPPPVQQEWYLDKLRTNLDSASASSIRNVAAFSTNITSTASKSKSGPSSTQSDSVVALSGVQKENASTEVVIGRNLFQSWTIGQKVKSKKKVRIAGPEKVNSTDQTQSPPVNKHILPDAPQAKEHIAIEDDKIVDLCTALHAADKEILSLGYLYDEEHMRYDFRLEKPNNDPNETHELVSLEALLAASGRLKISRKQRFRLALVLASSILQLQTTPWLSEHLEKKNVYFYRRGSEILADQPYIRQPFVAKNPNPSKETENSSLPACTPEQTNQRFAIRSATRSSLVHLGILLLELCFGQAIEKQTDLRKEYLMDGKPHNDTDYLTARDWIYEVGEEAGEEFENAVKCCVLCNFDVKPNWADTNFTQSVYVGVVQPLEKAYRMFESAE